MGLKFGILGLGQCGTNIAEYAFNKDFKVVVANTAQVDLNQARYISNDCKVKLPGNGAGRDRIVGFNAIIDNADELYKKCKLEFSDCDAIFVAFSGGGGTGSGAAPIGIEIALNICNYVGTIITLPDDRESPKAKMNTLECFKQISNFDTLGSVFIIDNERAHKLHPEISRNKIYELTNRQIIDYLVDLNYLTDKLAYVSNFDAGDLLGIIQERGYTLISKVEYQFNDAETKNDVSVKLRESWQRVYQPQIEQQQITKAAIIGKVSEQISTLIEPELIFKETGVPYDFNEVYFKRDNIGSNFDGKQRGVFYTILSGLAFPNERLSTMQTNVKNLEERLITQANHSINQRFETDDWANKFNILNKKSIKELPKTINIIDALSKYKN